MKLSIKKLLAGHKEHPAHVLDRMGNTVKAAERQAADYLNRKTAGWSQQKMKALFVLFFLVSGSIILMIAGRAILSANGPPKKIRVQSVLKPAPLSTPGINRPGAAGSTNKKN